MEHTIQGIKITADAETGETVKAEACTWGITPPPPGVCQVCATDHPPEMPHNAQSLFYQMAFKGKQGRWPTWEDAASHCSERVRKAWKDAFVEMGHAWTAPDSGLDPVAHLGPDQPIKK